MPEHRIRLEETVYYEVSVEAETEEEARAMVEEQLYGDEELDCYEVDNSGIQLSDH